MISRFPSAPQYQILEQKQIGEGLIMIKARRIEDKELPRETVLQEADRLVSVDRQNDYGHPLDTYTTVGRIWGALLGIPDIPAETVCLMMDGVKLGREKQKPKHDNRVDGPGYWKCLDLCIEERARRSKEADEKGRNA